MISSGGDLDNKLDRSYWCYEAIISDKRLLGFSSECSECGNKTSSDGKLYGKRVDRNRWLWAIGFFCSYCDSIGPVWGQRYNKIIQQVLASFIQQVLADFFRQVLIYQQLTDKKRLEYVRDIIAEDNSRGKLGRGYWFWEIVISNKRLLGFAKRCPRCAGEIPSDGKLYGKKLVRNCWFWGVGFVCNSCGIVAPEWEEKYNKIIREVLADFAQQVLADFVRQVLTD